jgi:hypothetical protein
MQPLLGFEPSSTTKRLMYYVSKKKYQIGSTTMPGLVEDCYSDIMVSFFLVALVLEVVGLWFIIDAIGAGVAQGLMGVLFLVLLDILFAFLFHLKAKILCRCRNEMVVLPLRAIGGAVGAETAILESRISRSKILGFFFVFIYMGYRRHQGRLVLCLDGGGFGRGS